MQAREAPSPKSGPGHVLCKTQMPDFEVLTLLCSDWFGSINYTSKINVIFSVGYDWFKDYNRKIKSDNIHKGAR